jgi:hypothetical protein
MAPLPGADEVAEGVAASDAQADTAATGAENNEGQEG